MFFAWPCCSSGVEASWTRERCVSSGRVRGIGNGGLGIVPTYSITSRSYAAWGDDGVRGDKTDDGGVHRNTGGEVERQLVHCLHVYRLISIRTG